MKADIMEGELTEFIGLACYKASLKGRPGISERILTDLLLIALSDGVQIEGLETWLRQAHMKIACPYVLPTDLKSIESLYFTNIEDSTSGYRLFQTTGEFKKAFPRLSAQGTLVLYEPYIDVLLTVAFGDEHSETLRFVSLIQNNRRIPDRLPYGGLRALINDVEFIVAEIQRVMRDAFHFKRSNPPLRQGAYSNITQAAAAFDQKLENLQDASIHIDRLNKAWEGSGLGQRLLQKTRHFDVPCVFLEFVRAFKDSLLRIAQSFNSQSFSKEEISEYLWNELQTLESPLQRMAENPVELWQSLARRIELWNRALLAKADTPHFRKHERSGGGLVPGGFVTCFDVRGTTSRLSVISSQRQDGAYSDVQNWRLTAEAIPRNWSILFAGQIQNVNGDTEIGFFVNFRDAINSALLALTHARFLNEVIEEPATFFFAMRAGVGIGKSDGANEIFHEVKALTEIKRSGHAPNDSLLVALQGFAQDHELALLQTMTFDSDHGPFVELDHRAMAHKMTTALLGKLAQSGSA